MSPKVSCVIVYRKIQDRKEGGVQMLLRFHTNTTGILQAENPHISALYLEIKLRLQVLLSQWIPFRNFSCLLEEVFPFSPYPQKKKKQLCNVTTHTLCNPHEVRLKQKFPLMTKDRFDSLTKIPVWHRKAAQDALSSGLLSKAAHFQPQKHQALCRKKLQLADQTHPKYYSSGKPLVH